MIDISPELKFKTARSGGKGGQNVNKVETMVEGRFHVMNSTLLTDAQKERLAAQLAGRISAEGFLQVRSQVHRSQLANKENVIEKIHYLIASALKKEKRRVPTKPGKKARERRLELKKKEAVIKDNRKKIRYIDH